MPEEKLHIIFFPMLIRSHMILMLDTMRVITAHRGGRTVRATVVTTPANAHVVTSYSPPVNAELRLIPFPSEGHSLSAGVENLMDLPLDLHPDIYSAVFKLQPHFEAIIDELRPDAIICDDILTWTSKIAANYGVPHLVFRSFGLFPLSAIRGVHLHKLYAGNDGRDAHFSIPSFPHSLNFTRSELPETFDHSLNFTRSELHDTFDYPFFLDWQIEAELRSFGVIVNSFYELEPEYADYYGKIMAPKKLFLVGPVAQCHPQGQPDDCLTWLGSKPDRSVLYLSFGTLGRFSNQQLKELALGLVESGKSFLWVLPAKFADEWMPDEFNKREQGRGLVVRRWVPQREILKHRAIGGFVMQCGWSSVMESVAAGLPMLTWPLHYEQFLTEKLITQVLKIGLPIWDGFKSVKEEEKVVVPASAVKRAVERLLGNSQEAEEIARRAKVLQEAARRATAEGGSSYNDIGRLIDDLVAKKVERGKK